MHFEKIIEKCREILECDTARICLAGGTMYFILGFNRNTKEDEGQWFKNDEPIDFDYVNETVVASGRTEEELIDSVKEYKRLSEITWEEYFKEFVNH